MLPRRLRPLIGETFIDGETFSYSPTGKHNLAECFPVDHKVLPGKHFRPAAVTGKHFKYISEPKRVNVSPSASPARDARANVSPSHPQPPRPVRNVSPSPARCHGSRRNVAPSTPRVNVAPSGRQRDGETFQKMFPRLRSAGCNRDGETFS